MLHTWHLWVAILPDTQQTVACDADAIQIYHWLILAPICLQSFVQLPPEALLAALCMQAIMQLLSISMPSIQLTAGHDPGPSQ